MNASEGSESRDIGLQPTATSRQLQTVAGDYWTVWEGGEDFPVVVCDGEMVEEFFPDKRYPFSAQQANGTWYPRYMFGSAFVNERLFPIFYPGTRNW